MVAEAERATSEFLRNFVLCPHNEQYDIAEWRTLLWTQALPSQHADKAAGVYEVWLSLRYRCLMPSAEVLSLLKKLRRNHTLAIITNGTSASQWEKVEKLKLRSYFDLILVSGDLPWEKPDKNIFLQACGILGVQPQNCIMIGDKLETDILGGRDASLAATVWICGRDSPLPFNFHPDFSLSSVLELPRILPLHKPSRPYLDIDDVNSNGSDGS